MRVASRPTTSPTLKSRLPAVVAVKVPPVPPLAAEEGGGPLPEGLRDWVHAQPRGDPAERNRRRLVANGWRRGQRRLINTRQWQRANPITVKGTVARLELINQSGLPPMKVISASTLAQLGRIPRSTEGHAVDAIDAVRKHGADEYNYCKAVIVMFSHRWKRPNWCEARSKDVAWGSEEHSAALAAGDYIGDPDDAAHSKTRALLNWTQWFKKDVSTIGISGTKSGSLEIFDLPPSIEEVYFWIDWPCIDQTNPAPGVAALPAYVSTCHAICAAWNDEYADRAWCRVELITAQAFMRTGDRIFVCEETSAPLLTDTKVHKEKVKVSHPLDGRLTNEAIRFPCSAGKQEKLAAMTTSGVPQALASRGMSQAEWAECCKAVNSVADAQFFKACPGLETLYYCFPGGPIQCALCLVNPCTCILCSGPVEKARKACRDKCTTILSKYQYKVRLPDFEDDIIFEPATRRFRPCIAFRHRRWCRI